MTSVGKLVSRHMEKEGFPKMEESFAKELPDKYVPGQVVVKRAVYKDNGEYEVAYDTIEVGEDEELLAIAMLEEEADIVSAEPNVNIEFEIAKPSSPFVSLGVPSVDVGPNYGKQWGLTKIGMLDAWEIEKGSNTVNIAIIDTGCDLDHEDLAENIDIDKSYDYVNNNGTPDDDNGHGTHVAGIIAAVGGNDEGGSGVMWVSNLIILKILNQAGELETSVTSDSTKLADAISDAIVDKDAKIINMSCGTTTDLMEISTLKDAFEAAFAEDVLIVAAAGNDENEGVLYPAKYEGVLSVAATDKNDQRSDGTAYGAEVDIAAPGEAIYSTEVDNSYGYQTGTSMSTAFVSGVAGLLLSKDSSLNKLQLKVLIENSADAIAGSGMGTGRLNAKKALDALEAGVGDVVAVAYVGESGQTEITVETGEEVQFYGDESTSEGELTYQWDFGDSGISNEENPVHTYAEEGDYNAILIASAGDGYISDTASVNATVEGESDEGEEESKIVIVEGRVRDEDGNSIKDVAIEILWTFIPVGWNDTGAIKYAPNSYYIRTTKRGYHGGARLGEEKYLATKGKFEDPRYDNLTKFMKAGDGIKFNFVLRVGEGGHNHVGHVPPLGPIVARAHTDSDGNYTLELDLDFSGTICADGKKVKFEENPLEVCDSFYSVNLGEGPTS